MPASEIRQTWGGACPKRLKTPAIENVWHILKRKMRQRRPHTVAHLKTCLQEEWDKITAETLHHLVSSVPKRLLSVVKRNGNITKW